MAEDEILAIFDPTGRRVGAKPRSLVHRDGDWHWTVFVWAARRGDDGRGRVIEHYYLCCRPVDLREAVFGEECSGFVEVDLEGLGELLAGARAELDGTGRLAAEPGEVHPVQLSARHLAAYSQEIVESCRRSVQAIRVYLATGRVDRGIWV